MECGEGWLMRPVVAGLLHYESLLGTRLRLYDVALLNDALDVSTENERRMMDSRRRS